MGKKKVIPRNATPIDTIFLYFDELAKNNMNKSYTARKLGISRNMLHKYIDRYWDDYKMLKDTKRQAPRLLIHERAVKNIIEADEELRDVRKKVTNSVLNAINEMDFRIKNEREKVLSRDLINYINTMLPYSAEKLLPSNSEVESQKTPHNTFVQNFINQMNNQIKQ